MNKQWLVVGERLQPLDERSRNIDFRRLFRILLTFPRNRNCCTVHNCSGLGPVYFDWVSAGATDSSRQHLEWLLISFNQISGRFEARFSALHSYRVIRMIIQTHLLNISKLMSGTWPALSPICKTDFGLQLRALPAANLAAYVDCH